MAEERSGDEQQQKRRRWRLRLDDLKASWSPSGGLTLAGGGVLGVVLVLLAWLIFLKPQSQVKPTAVEVQREPTSSAGPSPFMPPVGQDQPNITPPAKTGGEFTGDTPGLFGEKDDKPSCDAQSLTAYLRANPAKAKAWADALGLRPGDIPSYVASLTPVVLRSDTAVTNYRYANSRFFAYPAVLQAGTAVFINSYGEPKVKCFCGNPLTKAKSYPQARYVGPAWQHFQPKSVTVIHRTPTVIKNYTIINIFKHTTVYRPAPPPRHNDDDWHCKKYPDSHECQGGTTPPAETPPAETPPAEPPPYEPPPAEPPPYEPPPAEPPPAEPPPYEPPPAEPPPAEPPPAEPAVPDELDDSGNRGDSGDSGDSGNSGDSGDSGNPR
jgi:hypothetical protein